MIKNAYKDGFLKKGMEIVGAVDINKYRFNDLTKEEQDKIIRQKILNHLMYFVVGKILKKKEFR